MEMTKTTIDRRVARTRAKLQQALGLLIQKESYEAISIKNICAAADVGRSTFYAHYKSKDDLKRRGLELHLQPLLRARQHAFAGADTAGGPSLGFSLAMFEHAREYQQAYRALAGGRGGAVALGTIRQILSNLVREELTRTSPGPAPAIPREVVVQYVLGAYMGRPSAPRSVDY